MEEQKVEKRYEFFIPRVDEELLSLQRLAKRIDRSYAGVRRWAIEGVNGVRLKMCRTTWGYGTSVDQYKLFRYKVARTVIPHPQGTIEISAS